MNAKAIWLLETIAGGVSIFTKDFIVSLEKENGK